MSLTEEQLRDRGIFRGYEELVAEARVMLDLALADLPVGRAGGDPAREFSEGEFSALRAVGLDPSRRERSGDLLSRTASRYGAMMASALTVDEAAALLAVTAGRVRQRLTDGTLYGIEVAGGERRLPRFQFSEEGEVPGVGKVLRGLDPGLHPVSVENFFINPGPDLYLDEGEDEPVSPRDWLLSGGGPEAVIPLAGEL
ncbi:MAG: DNA-binding protein [Rubrobacteraceae bacterium]